MGIGSGVGAQWSFVSEPTYGTATTTDHATEFESESLRVNQKWTDPNGLAAGRQMQLLSRKVQTTRDAGGGVTVPYVSKKMGLLVRNCLGSATTTATLISGSAYKQVHQLGDFLGVQLTQQVGRPQPDGTVKPFTYPGSKVTSWTLSSAEDQELKLALEFDAKDETTATGLSVATYPTATELFTHQQLVVKLGGTASTASSVVSIASGVTLASVLKGISVKGVNPFASERYGTGATKGQPIQNGLTDVTIELDLEFTSQSEIYDVWRAGTQIAFQATWTGSAIAGGNNVCDLVVAAAKFTDSAPNVDGPDIVRAKATLEVGSDGTNNPFQWTINSLDTAL
jgi:hypothetical protein